MKIRALQKKLKTIGGRREWLTTLVLGVDCQIKERCQRYALHLKAKTSTGQGVYQWHVMPNDSKDCELFVEKYPVQTSKD